MWLLVFLFCHIWVPVFLRFERQLILNNRETPQLLRGMRDRTKFLGRESPLHQCLTVLYEVFGFGRIFLRCCGFGWFFSSVLRFLIYPNAPIVMDRTRNMVDNKGNKWLGLIYRTVGRANPEALGVVLGLFRGVYCPRFKTDMPFPFLTWHFCCILQHRIPE